MNRMVLSLVVVVVLGAAPAVAQEAGHVKVAKGAVQIERGGQKLPATLGAVVQAGDVVATGADGSVGITFLDNSLLSAGPQQRARDRSIRVRLDHAPGLVRELAQEGHARRRLRQARQAVARRHEGEDARRGAGRARHRVPRPHRRPEELTRRCGDGQPGRPRGARGAPPGGLRQAHARRSLRADTGQGRQDGRSERGERRSADRPRPAVRLRARDGARSRGGGRRSPSRRPARPSAPRWTRSRRGRSPSSSISSRPGTS